MRRLETPPYRFALPQEAKLRLLFERARQAPNGIEEQEALRDGVCSLVKRAKDDGRQVETVIVALKDIFGLPDRPNRPFRDDENAPPATVLVRRVVRWCIEEYYGQL